MCPCVRLFNLDERFIQRLMTCILARFVLFLKIHLSILFLPFHPYFLFDIFDTCCLFLPGHQTENIISGIRVLSRLGCYGLTKLLIDKHSTEYRA